MTALIACAHGTDDPAGRAVVDDLVVQSAALTGAPAHRAFVDVQDPRVDDVVAAVEGDAVIVPLLLSTGFHTEVDIAGAARSRPGVTRTDPLGTHPLIAQVLATRLRAALGAEWREGDHVVLAAAGSSRPEAVADVEIAAEHLRALIPAPVSIGYVSAVSPRVAEAVASARAGGAERVIASTYLLAPGFFAGLVEACGADVVTAPLGADPRVAQVIADRFQSAREDRAD